MKSNRGGFSRKTLVTAALGAGAVHLVFGATGCRDKIQGLPPVGAWQRVEVQMRDPKSIKTFVKVASSTDSAALKQLALVMHSATKSEDHKCMDIGRMTVGLQDGGELTFHLLPGHDDSHFEFRFSSQLFYVERSEFAEAMNAVGWTQFPVVP